VYGKGKQLCADIDRLCCIEQSFIVCRPQLQSMLFLDICIVWRDVYWSTHCQFGGVYVVGWFEPGWVFSAWILEIVFFNDNSLFVHV